MPICPREPSLANSAHEIVTRPDEELPPSQAKQLADGLGKVLGSKPGETWVRLSSLPAEHCAVGPGDSGDFFPVFVTVLKAQLPAADALKDEGMRLRDLIAGLCDRLPENVHLQYLPPGRGRVAFDGALLRA
jgi:hypothetical protein